MTPLSATPIRSKGPPHLTGSHLKPPPLCPPLPSRLISDINFEFSILLWWNENAPRVLWCSFPREVGGVCVASPIQGRR